MLLNCDFIIVPRIVLSDTSLSKTDSLLLGLIVSLSLKNGYCFSSNKYLANSLNISTRTLSYSLKRLISQNYITSTRDSAGRKIYLNKEKIPIKASNNLEKNCTNEVEKNCNHNINSKYKNNKIKQGIIPYWMEHPEVCVSTPASKEEQEEMENLLKEFTSKKES